MIRVCVLPVAGREDPTQMLMMQAVNQQGRFEMRHGVHARFFAATRTCLRDRPDLLYFDWISRYIIGRSSLVSFIKMVAFWLDVQIAVNIFRRPVVWSLHNLQSHESGPGASWERRLQRYFARHVTIIRVFSQGAVARASILLGVKREKLRVVPVGNYVEYYPSEITPAAARVRLGLGAGDFVLLWLGSIRPYKGLHELIEIFRQVALPHWRLVIAGKPFIAAYAAEIAALAKADERIQVDARFIPEAELQVFYNAADVAVLPFAEVENTSSLIVAMGFRKPVVAPDLGVIGERLCRQRELVYQPGGLADALTVLAALPRERLEEIGEANYTEVTKYQWKDMGVIFQELLEKK